MSLTIADFFRDQPASQQLFEALLGMIEEIGQAELTVSKSQISFRRVKPFALAWQPAQYLKGRRLAPLVLTLSFPQRDPSLRWKEVVEPAPGRFIHHLELYSTADLDEEVRAWLQSAWDLAG
jgi:hypothetical protein